MEGTGLPIPLKTTILLPASEPLPPEPEMANETRSRRRKQTTQENRLGVVHSNHNQDETAPWTDMLRLQIQ